jgi:hypothetical protein
VIPDPLETASSSRLGEQTSHQTIAKVTLARSSGGSVVGGGTSDVSGALASQGAAQKPTRLIATNCRVHNDSSGNTQKYFNSRTIHAVREGVRRLRVVLANWYTESDGPGPVTFTAAIEYNGTIVGATFGGSASVTVQPGGEAVSDWINIAIPQDAFFYVRMFGNGPTGIPYFGYDHINSLQNTAQGAAMAISSTPIADLTMGGTITSTFNTAGFNPLAILGETDRPSVALVGDSICAGANDVYDGTHAALGYLERAIEPFWPTMNLGKFGEGGPSFLSAGPRRARAVNAYCSHVVIQYGVNDRTSTAAAIKATILDTAKLFPGKTLLRTTLTHVSTGAWTLADRSDQTLETNSTLGNTIDAVNTWLRSGAALGYHGLIDCTSGAFAADNKWLADGTTAKNTSDGVHPSQAAAKSMGAVFDWTLIN